MPAFGGSRAVQFAPITLYTEFQQQPPTAVQQALETELATIMAPAEIHFEWYPLAEAGGRVSSQLAIIRFKGECDTDDLRPQWEFTGPLGWTYIGDGEILPFIAIDCEGIRLLLQRELLDVPLCNRPRVFGRAVARVLAHELYHFLAHTKHHAGSGIAKAAYGVSELLSQSLQFGKKEYELLRSRTHHGAFEAEAGDDPEGSY
jgi:hypothetical protein